MVLISSKTSKMIPRANQIGFDVTNIELPLQASFQLFLSLLYLQFSYYFQLCGRIHQLLGIRNPTSVDGLTWKLLRSTRNDCNVYNELRIDTCSELSQALNLMHECFEPIIEHHTKRDLIVDIVYNSVSKFKRLDFRGFYIMALQKDDEFVCAATVR
ncbi:unnamed protein product, partial [Vitis vinifera]